MVANVVTITDHHDMKNAAAVELSHIYKVLPNKNGGSSTTFMRYLLEKTAGSEAGTFNRNWKWRDIVLDFTDEFLSDEFHPTVGVSFENMLDQRNFLFPA